MARNKTDLLYEVIIKKIAAGEYEPDSFLREEELAKTGPHMTIDIHAILS